MTNYERILRSRMAQAHSELDTFGNCAESVVTRFAFAPSMIELYAVTRINLLEQEIDRMVAASLGAS
jgi:hypothetical protein